MTVATVNASHNRQTNGLAEWENEPPAAPARALAEAGCSAHEIQAITGHRTLQMVWQTLVDLPPTD